MYLLTTFFRKKIFLCIITVRIGNLKRTDSIPCFHTGFFSILRNIRILKEVVKERPLSLPLEGYDRRSSIPRRENVTTETKLKTGPLLRKDQTINTRKTVNNYEK